MLPIETARVWAFLEKEHRKLGGLHLARRVDGPHWRRRRKNHSPRQTPYQPLGPGILQRRLDPLRWRLVNPASMPVPVSEIAPEEILQKTAKITKERQPNHPFRELVSAVALIQPHQGWTRQSGQQAAQ